MVKGVSGVKGVALIRNNERNSKYGTNQITCLRSHPPEISYSLTQPAELLAVFSLSAILKEGDKFEDVEQFVTGIVQACPQTNQIKKHKTTPTLTMEFHQAVAYA